ncbi:MAG TPA: CcdB family protein [Verrucomicrobiae bacterium]|nr:CcdB family protein [Verrucomicrobiae bacterium]
MAQFHAYANPGQKTADRAPFLLDVQSDLVNVRARVIVMLVAPSYFGKRMRGLNPLLNVNGVEVVMSPTEIGAIQSKHLGPAIADLSAHRQQITAAMNFLLTGF